MELTICPECGEPAEIQSRAILASTDGPIEHAKILCIQNHWFLLPIASLARVPLTADPEWHRLLGCHARGRRHLPVGPRALRRAFQ